MSAVAARGGRGAHRVALHRWPQTWRERDTREVALDVERARALLAAKRAEVQKLLAETETAGREDRSSEDEKGTDVADPAQSLTQQGMDDAIAETLSDRLAALERGEQRLGGGHSRRVAPSGEA